MHDQRSSVQALPVVLLLLLSLIWGTSFILIKRGLEVFSPDEVGALRVASASLFLLPVALVKLRELRARHYGRLFFSGMLGVFMPAFLFAAAQTQLPSSVTGVANTLTPLLTLIIGSAFFGVAFRRQSLIGILVGFAGTVVLIMARSSSGMQGVNLYMLLVVLACIMYATNLNYIKYKIPDLKAVTITGVSLLLIGPLAVVYLFGVSDFMETLQTQPGGWKACGYVVLLGLMSTSVATVLFNTLVKMTSPLFTSSVTYIIPLVAIMWGVLDGEALYLGHYIGMAAIVGGVYLVNRRA